MDLPPLPPLMTEPLIRAALHEDLGRAGDITSNATIPPGTMARLALVTRRDGVVAGLDLAAQAFALVDPAVQVTRGVADGDRVAAGDVLARVSGPARSLLMAERVALNMMCHLSGIATATREMVDAIAGHKARIVCTRKTTPGLRMVEKYAVRAGGGGNHRYGLDDAVLIKDNHIAIAGGIAPALHAARAHAGHMVKIQIEVDTLDQLAEVMAIGADAVLLDNMTPEMLARAVDLVAGRALTEASGGVTLASAPALAASGVDLISCGWLTHSAPILDIGLDFTA